MLSAATIGVFSMGSVFGLVPSASANPLSGTGSIVAAPTAQPASAEVGNPPNLTGPAAQGSWVVTPANPSVPAFTADPNNTNYAPPDTTVAPPKSLTDPTGSESLTPSALNQYMSPDGRNIYNIITNMTPGAVPALPSDDDLDNAIDQMLDRRQQPVLQHMDPLPQQDDEVGLEDGFPDTAATEQYADASAIDPSGEESTAPADSDADEVPGTIDANSADDADVDVSDTNQTATDARDQDMSDTDTSDEGASDTDVSDSGVSDTDTSTDSGDADSSDADGDFGGDTGTAGTDSGADSSSGSDSGSDGGFGGNAGGDSSGNSGGDSGSSSGGDGGF